MSTNHKAYIVREADGDGGACVVWAKNGAEARRFGASELNTEWEGIEGCGRAADMDHMEDWPREKINRYLVEKRGWWFTCADTGNRIDLDEPDCRPVYDGELVYFNPWTWLWWCEEQANSRRRKTELHAHLVAEYSYAEITHVNEYDGSATLKIEGFNGLVTWRDVKWRSARPSIHPHQTTIHVDDAERWFELIGKPMPVEVAENVAKVRKQRAEWNADMEARRQAA